MISNLTHQIDNDVEKIVDVILKCDGKLVVSGIGKSGIVGKKIAATLASTGTPSFFMHPSEAFHGDLGMIESKDVVLTISNSGESDEILKLIPFFKDNGNIIISMTGNDSSTLAINSRYHLSIYVKQEACPLELAPTSSTTATMVLGDALAIALMEKRGFKRENFARFHPGGSLGKRLLTNVSDIMIKENLPYADPNTSVLEIISIISKSHLGLVIITNNHTLVGIITDGDIRKALYKNQENFINLNAKDIMSINPKTSNTDITIDQAKSIMESGNINSLLIMEKNSICGVLTYKQLFEI